MHINKIVQKLHTKCIRSFEKPKVFSPRKNSRLKLLNLQPWKRLWLKRSCGILSVWTSRKTDNVFKNILFVFSHYIVLVKYFRQQSINNEKCHKIAVCPKTKLSHKPIMRLRKFILENEGVFRKYTKFVKFWYWVMAFLKRKYLILPYLSCTVTITDVIWTNRALNLRF